MSVSHERETQFSLHLYRVFAKSFKSVSTHVANGARIDGLNPTAFAVMEVLYSQGPQPIQQVGAQLLLQSGNVTYVVDKLEAKGYVRRRPCRDDRRVIFADLTKAGRALMDQLFPHYTEQIHTALSGLNEAEKSELLTLLNKLGDRAEAVSHPL
ncbi:MULTISPECIES: MarR family winged helix-turn-helix transcriptional regulator [Paenibacillus]|uniref:MarR family transcriptional regulator n=1 Tax=Paenibacillus campinasensis TaxID=66347 RepID=A0A268EQY3_9BACL|nr:MULTISPECIES: MarR family winged helix-turn-helix transcriptional regulator [Paenibacillus]MUG68177.1 MarR family transcriptional regulator [Paenibacillus campinasensis]PAD75507.1 MarR family transcriptional regulator [Paenibacillus campinasensis]PAK51493.1 MarR family transcriptional regulator [Paenibacillus sp. 7541]